MGQTATHPTVAAASPYQCQCEHERYLHRNHYQQYLCGHIEHYRNRTSQSIGNLKWKFSGLFRRYNYPEPPQAQPLINGAAPEEFSTNTGNINTLARTNATTVMGGLYKVTVTNAGGCTASASRSISVNAPTAATVTGATSVCGNANVELTATTAGVSYG